MCGKKQVKKPPENKSLWLFRIGFQEVKQKKKIVRRDGIKPQSGLEMLSNITQKIEFRGYHC